MSIRYTRMVHLKWLLPCRWKGKPAQWWYLEQDWTWTQSQPHLTWSEWPPTFFWEGIKGEEGQVRVSCAKNCHPEICFPGSPSSATAINGSSLPGSPSKLASVPGSPLVQQAAGNNPAASAATPASASPLAALGSGKQSFYYRDPALPNGWYIKVDRTQVGAGKDLLFD